MPGAVGAEAEMRSPQPHVESQGEFITAPVLRICATALLRICYYTPLMSFAAAQKEVDDWISQFEEGYFAPLPMLARLTEEVRELSRALMHHHAGKKPKPDEDEGNIGGEIADAMFVLICLANSLEIDLDTEFAAMMQKYRVRDAERWTPKR